jgi:hypothetical protein
VIGGMRWFCHPFRRGLAVAPHEPCAAIANLPE